MKKYLLCLGILSITSIILIGCGKKENEVVETSETMQETSSVTETDSTEGTEDYSDVAGTGFSEGHYLADPEGGESVSDEELAAMPDPEDEIADEGEAAELLKKLETKYKFTVTNLEAVDFINYLQYEKLYKACAACVHDAYLNCDTATNVEIVKDSIQSNAEGGVFEIIPEGYTGDEKIRISYNFNGDYFNVSYVLE